MLDNTFNRNFCSFYQVCFFRQFFGSVTKVDYLTLRHGFIMVTRLYNYNNFYIKYLYIWEWSELLFLYVFQAHLAPGSETKFDFNKYISRSLEGDFVVVVGITYVLSGSSLKSQEVLWLLVLYFRIPTFVLCMQSCSMVGCSVVSAD